MKCSRIVAIAALLCLTSSLAMAQTTTAPAAAAPVATTVQSLNDALVTISVGDVPGLLDQFGKLASQTDPTFSGESLKAMLGAQMGDPELKGMPAGSGALILLFPNTEPVSLIEVAPESLESYKTSAAATGNLAEAADGLLAVAENEAGLAAAKAVASEAKALLGGAGQPNVNGLVRMQKISQMYGPMIEMGIGTMVGFMAQAQAQAQAAAATQPAMDMQAVQKILEGEVRGVWEVLSQVETLSLTLSFDEKGAMIEKVVTPIAGSALATLAGASVQSPEALAKFVAPGGGMMAYMGCNGDAIAEFANAVTTAVSTKMTIDPASLKTLTDLWDLMRGSQGWAMSYMLPGAQGFNGVTISKYASPEVATERLAAMAQQMTADGALATMYKGMGIAVSIKEKVREVDGIAVNEMTMDITNPDLPKSGLYPMIFEYAIVDSYMVQSVGTGSIESHIQAVKAGGYPQAATLKAASALPQGQHGYGDLALAETIRAFTSMIPAEEAEAMGDINELADKLQGASPISFSAKVGDGAMGGYLIIPADLIAKFAQIAREQGAATAVETMPAATAPAM